MATPLSLVAEPRRREILQLIWRQERAAGEIASLLPVTFGAVSQHLRLLREAGLVSMRRDGQRHFYVARPEQFGPLVHVLEAMWVTGLDELKSLTEEEERASARAGRATVRRSSGRKKGHP